MKKNKTAADVSNQIRREITDKIVESLKQNKIPWRKTWSDDPNCGRPINVVSKKFYSGINPLILEITSLEKGYHSRWWATYKQFAELHGQVRKGEKSTQIVFYKVLEVDDTKKDGSPTKKKIFFLRTYNVFNLDQADGEKLDKYRVKEEPADPPADIAEHLSNITAAEQLVKDTGAKISYGGNRAYYATPTPKGTWPRHTDGDFIRVPKRKQFADAAEFYITTFHELAHWSEVRLTWDNTYEMNELVAEITACYLAAETGVPNRSMENHNRYLASWLQKMQTDPKWIFHASTQASKVSDFLLGGCKDTTSSSLLGHEPSGEIEEQEEQAA